MLQEHIPVRIHHFEVKAWKHIGRKLHRNIYLKFHQDVEPIIFRVLEISTNRLQPLCSVSREKSIMSVG